MSERNGGVYPALKHAGYSGTALLPGEDPAAFRKLHRDLFAELRPVGPLEEDIVGSVVRWIWRKQHLSTYRTAHEARRAFLPGWSDRVGASILQSEEDGRAKVGDAWELVKIGEVATTEYLQGELSVEDRLDRMIERGLKRLLLVRGIKSMLPSAQPSPPTKLLTAAE